jgi:hypothetical protein
LNLLISTALPVKLLASSNASELLKGNYGSVEQLLAMAKTQEEKNLFYKNFIRNVFVNPATPFKNSGVLELLRLCTKSPTKDCKRGSMNRIF